MRTVSSAILAARQNLFLIIDYFEIYAFVKYNILFILRVILFIVDILVVVYLSLHIDMDNDIDQGPDSQKDTINFILKLL